jgi:hypothetical protein
VLGSGDLANADLRFKSPLRVGRFSIDYFIIPRLKTAGPKKQDPDNEAQVRPGQAIFNRLCDQAIWLTPIFDSNC